MRTDEQVSSNKLLSSNFSLLSKFKSSPLCSPLEIRLRQFCGDALQGCSDSALLSVHYEHTAYRHIYCGTKYTSPCVWHYSNCGRKKRQKKCTIHLYSILYNCIFKFLVTISYKLQAIF